MINSEIIYFVTQNQLKEKEVKKLWKSDKYKLEIYNYTILEIQSQHIEEIAKQKAKEAYNKLHRPVFVEHSGLLLTPYGNLPGGFTKIVWDSLTTENNFEKFSKLFAPNGETHATAQTILSYCDGRKVYSFKGEIQGKIINPPRGSTDKFWDCVFQPCNDNQQRTFAEMDNETKNKFSMRAIAMELFMAHLDSNKF